MMKDSDLQELIDWGKATDHTDFSEAVAFFRDRKADQKTVVVETDGKVIEGCIEKIYFSYKIPFNDFDFTFWIKDYPTKIRLAYTCLEMFQKMADNMFSVDTTQDKHITIKCKED